jgi:hypothetical protein
MNDSGAWQGDWKARLYERVRERRRGAALGPSLSAMPGGSMAGVTQRGEVVPACFHTRPIRPWGPSHTAAMTEPNLSSFIWSVADLLRGDYKQSEYGKVILPFTVLRRLDCVLEATKPAVLAEKKQREKAKLHPEPLLNHAQLWEALRAKSLRGEQRESES